MFTVNPIGYCYSSFLEKYQAPRQANLHQGTTGTIILNSGCHFEQALEGLEYFDRIWVVFLFHRNRVWKPKVFPPRGGKKQGVFATRSPHRPNFIGLSCVSLVAVKGLQIWIKDHDLLHGTPVLDLKPYLNYADSFQSSKQGWLEHLEVSPTFTVEWSLNAQSQLCYLLQAGSLDLKDVIEFRLKENPFPYPNRRVKQIDSSYYELAYKTWRIFYHVEGQNITIIMIKSGYDQLTLQGKKESRWDDVPLHVAFSLTFNLFSEDG